MIGWRVGWIVAPESHIPDLAAVSLANVVVPVGIGQDAVAVALERSAATLPAYVGELERRRDKVMAELRGLSFGVPGGGWSLLLARLRSRHRRSRDVAASPRPEGRGDRHGGLGRAPWRRIHPILVFSNGTGLAARGPWRKGARRARSMIPTGDEKALLEQRHAARCSRAAQTSSRENWADAAPPEPAFRVIVTARDLRSLAPVT